MVRGTPVVKRHGEYVPVRAPVINIDALAAHADQRELLQWLGTAPKRPREVFIMHGEPGASNARRREIKDRLGWHSPTPEAMEKAEPR